jgi:chemotaxis protein methyltransferase CheR
MNKSDHEERDFLLLKDKIYRATSLDCHQYKDNYLKRRINVRMHVWGVKTYGEYLRILNSYPGEYKELMEDITINVTQFFRDPEVYKLMEEEILPLLIYDKVKNNRRVIRFWSAGCASGEEPYSMAILMDDLLGEESKSFMVSIQGTDIDETCLTAARDGIYLPRQIENVRPKYLSRYFQYDGEMYHISDRIKDMVRFKKQDLFSDKKGAHFDLITCRNVLIYFTKEMQQKLFLQFLNQLNEGGYLIIGKTETMIGEFSKKFHPVDLRERIYQKVSRINP